MNNQMSNDQIRMLNDIGMIDFVLVEMNEYLDTHPRDKEAIEYFQHYNRIKNQAMKDYAAKYGPLSLASSEFASSSEWEWALQPMPWEGVC